MKTKSHLFLSAATTSLLAIVCAVPSSAKGQCVQWDVVNGGQWELRQSNNLILTINLQRNGKLLTGNAWFRKRKISKNILTKDDVYTGDREQGQVDGTFDGNNFTAQILWTYGETGVYTGKVNPQGRIEGSGYIEQDPNNAARKWTWYSNERMNCASQAATTPAPNSIQTPPPLKPVKTTGKARATPTPTATISPPPNDQSGPNHPTIFANKTVVRIPPGKGYSSALITWDAGKNHPYAEVWVKTEREDEQRIVEKGKGAQLMRVRPRSNLFILTDSGHRLATAAVEGSIR